VTTKINKGAAIAGALFLFLCGATPVLAHQEHKKQAENIEIEISQPETSALLHPSVPEEKSHDHSAHAPLPQSAGDKPEGDVPESNLPKPLAWLGKFHPPLTHFPIALLTAAAIAEFLYMRTGRVLFDHAVRFSVWFGAVGALAAASFGWLFAGFHLIDKEWVMTAHRWVGTSTALWAAGALYLYERVSAGMNSRVHFRTALFIGAALVGTTGFFGGALLYGLDHYAW
jgi:uncharacterized membrane protein